MSLEDLFHIDYNWSDLFLLSIILILVYLLLYFIRRIISSLVFIGRLRSIIRLTLEKVLVLYEPLSLFLVMSLFVMIKPIFHGIIIGSIVLLGFAHFRNYVHGRLIMIDRSLHLGRRLNILDHEGIITHMGRFGIQVRSDNGLHYMPYHLLVTQGFILSSGEKIGGYYNLQIKLQEDVEDKASLTELSHMLTSSPYVDGDHKPEISRSISSNRSVDVKLLVKEESHVYDLMALLDENGFLSVIIKS